MPRAAACSPKRACNNYPICSRAQLQKRSVHYRVHAVLLIPPAPVFGKSIVPMFCALHYADPCHNAEREWAMCTNARFGCRHLAMKRTA
eukprot:8326857-Pyramimonas_sp.AAC.1